MGFGRDDDEELRVPGTGVLAEEVEVVRVAEWGMDMVNYLSGAVGRGVEQSWTAANMDGMKWRVLRLSYKTYGGRTAV